MMTTIHPPLPDKGLDLAQMRFGDNTGYYHDRSIAFDVLTSCVPPELPPILSFESRIKRRKLGMQAISWQAPNAIVYLPGWGGTFESPITKLEIDHLTAEAPADTDIIRINLPGHGDSFRSTRWPRSVARDISHGDFFSAGKYIAPFLEGEIHHRQSLSILGTSFGGRIALGLAHNLKRPIDTVAIFDSPGTIAQTYKDFTQTYRQKEGHAASIYCQESPDTNLQALINTSARHSKTAQLGRLLRGSLLQYYYAEPAGMAAGTLPVELEAAELGNVKRLAFISPEASYLNEVSAVRRALQRVYSNQLRTRGENSTAIEHWTFPGTHAITRYSSNILGLVYGSVLRHEKLGSG